jgi:subtilisin family serine protease
LGSDPPVGLPPDIVHGDYLALAPPSLWHLPPNPWEQIWRNLDATGIRIAILDTGYTKHVDGPTPIVSRSYISGQSVRDGNGHGTHVAGTALGVGVGTCPGAKLMVYKVLSNGGSGSSSGIAAAVRQAVDDGAHIISASLGGGSSYGPTNSNIDYAWSRGCWVNMAAGNSGYNGSNTIGWPAKYDGCLCQAAYRRDGSIANFSSGGRQIDWACPGQEIISWSNNGSGFRSMSGTSMATPYGSGVLGIFYAYMLREGWPIISTTDMMRQFFKENMTDRGAPGFDYRFGHGIPLVDEILPNLIDSTLTYT